ncbi:MAG: class I SAM-dependent methyltransferase [Algicola sp.]|nr:class I SAM-dependent methyltransferase [Algicola sp.]
MNRHLLHTEIQHFIEENLHTNVSKLLLKGTSFPKVSTTEIVEQIEAKLKCKKKLPTWFSTNNIYYPNKLNIEQTSSEVSAKYKSQLITGKTIADLTGGFGVDSYYFSKQFKTVDHFEINKNLSEIVTHNLKQLGVTNVHTRATDGIDYLKSQSTFYDWLYLDPSRRHDVKGKVFFLNDCEPNVPERLDDLFELSDQILIKTSPLLDISSGISELSQVKTIHIVAVNNEVKELLWHIENGFNGDITIKTVNLLEESHQEFSFILKEESLANSRLDFPKSFLFEPNAAILKSGGFNSIANKFQLFKLHQHSHLYTSDDVIEFPGRSFKIESVIDYSKKSMRQLSNTKANITIRNFPESVQQIRGKYRIKDGGITYLFFTTNSDNKKIVIVCSKL